MRGYLVALQEKVHKVRKVHTAPTPWSRWPGDLQGARLGFVPGARHRLAPRSPSRPSRPGASPAPPWTALVPV